jgi:hypothetical protein
MTLLPRYLLVLDSSNVEHLDGGPYVADVFLGGEEISVRYLPAADCTAPTDHTDDAPVEPAWKVTLWESSETAYIAECDVAAVVDLWELPQDQFLHAVSEYAPDAVNSDNILN